ncbi:unnamed protein product [Microthlaspi erraticum]|uniref:FHA domain-containing protein n=1 Tax=Microthlaspi erraticum TaxID=1685480 RepID=A0A6D2KUT6_9BRAS|nr:unnamed protein product [Microthlaspi erraticum]
MLSLLNPATEKKGFQRAMEAPPRIRESEDIFGNENLSGEVASESSSSNGKRKFESAYGLFCVLRKRRSRHKSVDDDDMLPDLDYADSDDCLSPESDLRFEVPNYLEDEDVILVDTGEFDVISENEVGELKSLSICNFPWPCEDLVSNLCSETQNSILLLAPDEVNEVNAVRSNEDEVLATQKSQFLIRSEHSNRISSFHSEWSKIQCSSDIFKNDDDAMDEAGYGHVANMPLSMQELSSNDEPTPISIVPPDGVSSSSIQTCSLPKIVSCGNEYNVCDDKVGLPIPLTKTLEGTSRPWSVCSSLAAVKTVSLMEDCSGACNPLDEQLCVTVSSSEDKDAESAQTPSVLYQDVVDGGEDEICFSDIDAMIRKLNLLPDDSESCLNREERNMSRNPGHRLLGLKHCTTTSIRRAIKSRGAIAVLRSRDSKHLIRKHEVIIGRSSDVDIDLGQNGYGNKISRRQALVKLQNNGSFFLKNLGKRPILVNGDKLDTQQTVTLTSCSSIDIGGIVFAFKSNKEAVTQFLKKSKRRNSEEHDTKFGWCE